MYRAKPFLDKESLIALYYSYINSYQNYANLAFGSTYRTNLKKLCSQQKDAIQTTSSPAHLFSIRRKRKRGPGTLQTRDQNLPK